MKYDNFLEYNVNDNNTETFFIEGSIYTYDEKLWLVLKDSLNNHEMPIPGTNSEYWQKLEFACEDCVEMTGMKPSSLTQDEFWVCPCLEEYHRHFPLDLNGRPEGCCTRFAFKSESMPQLHAEMLRLKKQEEVEIQKMLKMQLLSMKTYEANRE